MTWPGLEPGPPQLEAGDFAWARARPITYLTTLSGISTPSNDWITVHNQLEKCVRKLNLRYYHGISLEGLRRPRKPSECRLISPEIEADRTATFDHGVRYLSGITEDDCNGRSWFWLSFWCLEKRPTFETTGAVASRVVLCWTLLQERTC
jgi:hypothetical protein